MFDDFDMMQEQRLWPWIDDESGETCEDWDDPTYYEDDEDDDDGDAEEADGNV